MTEFSYELRFPSEKQYLKLHKIRTDKERFCNLKKFISNFIKNKKFII